ncbi:MAG TPA: exopolyphosphatase [Geobacteraceae bacterium]
MQHPTAVIDFGTNTARLLIGYRAPSGSIVPLLVKRQITRLGGGFSREIGISREAEMRSIAALRDFAGEIRKHAVSRVRAVATSAVRDAANGEGFCAAMYRETGIRLEVIDSREEGLLTLRGVLAGIDDPQGDFLVFDVGGGSTEYTLTRQGEPVFTDSLPLGVVRLTEGKREPEAMGDKIFRELSVLSKKLDVVGFLGSLAGVTLVGTAGTATTLAAISLKMTDYDYRLVNNHILSLAEIRDIFRTLLPMTPEERLRVPGLEKGREDLIIAGIMITVKTMEMFGFQHLKVSDFGLLEGLLLSV